MLAVISVHGPRVLIRQAWKSNNFHRKLRVTLRPTPYCGLCSHHGRSSSTNHSTTPQVKFANQNDPFSILGISRNSSCETVKQAFYQLAMKHHPDRQLITRATTGSRDKDSATRFTTIAHTPTAEFIRIRQAFEQIQKGQHGRAMIAPQTDDDQQHNVWTEQDWRDFWQEQTRLMFHFEMDYETRQEIIQTVETLSPGGLDAGGTWFMARMIAQQQQYRRDTSNNTKDDETSVCIIRKFPPTLGVPNRRKRS